MARYTDYTCGYDYLSEYEFSDTVRNTGIAMGTGRPGNQPVGQPETGNGRSAERRCTDGDGKIAGYRKFYDWALIGSIIPLIVMLTYIFMHLYARAENLAAVQLITVSGIVFIILAIANTLFQYKKHVQRCKELLKQFEE